jgi:hypothetical protein
MQLPKQHSKYSRIGLRAAKPQHSRHYLIFTKNKIQASRSSMRPSQEVMDPQHFPYCRPDFWVEIHTVVSDALPDRQQAGSLFYIGLRSVGRYSKIGSAANPRVQRGDATNPFPKKTVAIAQGDPTPHDLLIPIFSHSLRPNQEAQFFR